jgi:hypothetical protein
MMKKNSWILILLLIGIINVNAQSAKDALVKYNQKDLIVDLGVGLWGSPIPVDYDSDGLIDILMVCPDTPYKGLYFYKNIGTLKNPLFDVSIKISEKAPKNTQASYVNNELKVISAGVEYTNFTMDLFESPNKIRVDVSPGDNFTRIRSNIWSYVDYDNDGDQDIIAGVDDWGEYGWDNAYDKNGIWTNGPLRGFVFLLEYNKGQYINKGKILADGQPMETYGAPGPNMADFDKDGLPDIICGEFTDKLSWFKNVGTSSLPKFTAGRYLFDNKMDTIRLHVEMITPVAVDFDKDGNIDLLVGDEDGSVAYIRNTGKVNSNMPVFEPVVYLKQKADYIKFGALSTPFNVDWDGDGNDDLISGNSAGNICFIKNVDGKASPKWNAPVLLKAYGKEIRIMAGKNGSIQGPAEDKWGYTTLSVADWDGDGKKDIVVNSIWGKIIWYKNNGDLINLEGPFNVKVDWAEKPIPKPQWNWWNPGKTDLVTQWRTTPYATDWNKDGMTDLICLDHEGYLTFFERFEKSGNLWLKPGIHIFYIENESGKKANNKDSFSEPQALQLSKGIAGKSGRIKFCLVDWNKDGKIDLMVNSSNTCYYENIKQTGDTICFKNNGDISPLKLAGHTTSPTPVDWDNDGIYDILTGAEDGHFYLLHNNTKK